MELPVQYSITSDRVPTIEELRDIIMVCKPRGKAPGLAAGLFWNKNQRGPVVEGEGRRLVSGG